MNREYLNQLQNRYIVSLDFEKEIEQPNSPKIQIRSLELKIIWHRPGIAQIQCLHTFKLLTLKNGELYFEEYFQLDKLEKSLFYIVYDDIALAVFPILDTKQILTFHDRLYLKNTDEIFQLEEQTIFCYDEIDYSNLSIISNHLTNKNVHLIDVANIREVLKAIINIYNQNEGLVLISMEKLMFPLDYYISMENWCLADRKFYLDSMNTYKRQLDLSILDSHEFIDENPDHWLEIESIEKRIPQRQNAQVIWQKLIGAYGNGPFYYSSIKTYIISIEQIRRRDIVYYQKLVGLLEKTRDLRIENLIEIGLMTIFYYI